MLISIASAPIHAQSEYASIAVDGPNDQVLAHRALQENLEKLNRIVTVHLESITVGEALRHLATLGGLKLAIDEEAETVRRVVTLHLEEVTLLKALHDVMRGMEGSLKISPGGHLVLVRDGPVASATVPRKPKTGIVRGRVVGAVNGQPLRGANIHLEGTPLGAASDENGEFLLDRVLPDEQTLNTSYLGYETRQTVVHVTAGHTTEVDVRLESRILETGELLVHGLRQSHVRALALRREAQNLKEVLSADAIGKLPDQNVAEAVQRVPGVTIQTDRGEGRFVFIRGTEPNLNNVTLNGQNLASTAESRATALDLLPSEMLSGIEVVKVFTPDMDGEALGGTINVQTLSAFDRRLPLLIGSAYGLRHQRTVEYGARELPYQVHATAGRLFGPRKRWGVVVSGSASRRDYAVSQANPVDWTLLNGRFLPGAFETEVEDTRRDRYAFSANLDLRPDDRTALFLRSYYAHTVERNEQAEYIFELGAGEATRQTETTGRIDAGAGGLDLGLTNLDERLLLTSLGGRRHMGAITLSVDGTYTRGVLGRFTRKPEFTSGSRSDFSFVYDVGGPFVALSFDDVGALRDPSNYAFSEIDVEYESNVENTWTAASDLRWDASLAGRPSYVRAGAKLRRRSKVVDDREEGYRAGPLAGTLALESRPTPATLQGGGMLPVLGDPESLFRYFERERDQAGYFVYDVAESQAEAVENDSHNQEFVAAGYLMGTVDLGVLGVLAGVRAEATRTTSRRWQLLADRGPEPGEVSEQRFGNRYVNVLPSVHLKLAPVQDLEVRASWSNSIGRPDYDELAGFRDVRLLEVDPGTYRGVVEEGNPALRPFESINLDASVDYYSSLGGLLSLNVFYKHIKNPIYEFLTTGHDVSFEGRFFRQLDRRQDRNADKGTIRGLEAACQQLLLFLPTPLNGVGISANVAFIASDVNVPGREEDRLPFFGQSDLVYNVIPYFQRGGLEVRLALSYQSASLAEVGEVAYEDVYADERSTVDLTATYALRGGSLKITGLVRNLTNEPERGYQHLPDRYVQHVLTGRTFLFGVTTSF